MFHRDGVVIFGLICISFCVSTGVTPARADVPLTLTNAGFEIANAFDQTAGCGSGTPCYNYSIVDWSQFGTSGTFNPSLGVPPIAPPAYQGNNVAFLNSSGYGGSYITQDLGDLMAGITYSISIEVASRGPQPDGTSPVYYRIGAATGGTAAAPTFTTYDQTSGIAPANPTLASDNWELVTFQFTPSTSGDWYTYISDDGPVGGGFGQLEVDAAVPEPSGLLLLVVMIGCVVVLQKKLVLRRWLD